MTQYIDFNSRTASQQASNALGFKSIQSWKSKSSITPEEPKPQDFQTTLSYTINEPRTVENLKPAQPPKNADGFQFNDVIDVINPLHHVPVIGMMYREMTGDSIKPASQIIGGGLFGGPIGALAGTINAVTQIQTGKDVGDTVLAIAGISSTTVSAHENINLLDDPESRLNAVAFAMKSNQGLSRDSLPSTAISFASLPEIGRGYTKTNMAEGRTAGNMIVQKQVAAYQNISFGQNKAAPVLDKIDLAFDLPARERITDLSIAPMPARHSF